MLRKIGLTVAASIFAVVVSACSMGQGVTVPDRPVTVDQQTAVDAQNMAMTGLMSGTVTLNESQFSSLLTGLLKANTGENNPINSINAWFEPDKTYLQVNVKDGVLPASFGNTLIVDGVVGADGSKLSVDLAAASAGPYKVEGAALAPINAQINAALANLNFGVPVQVQNGDGTLTVSLAQ